MNEALLFLHFLGLMLGAAGGFASGVLMRKALTMNASEAATVRGLGPLLAHVSAVGLGCMSMSGVYGPADRRDAIDTIHAALDAGITLLDTGDFYGMGHNEMLIAEALRDRPRDSYRLSVKFGGLRDPGNGWNGNDTRPAALKNFLAYSLQRLGTDYIDIYRPARLDSKVPIEKTVGAIAEMVKAGYVRNIGLSEVGAETLKRAAAVHPIVDLQIEYSLISRGIEDDILKTTRALGIGITAYGVLARGLIGGNWKKGQSAAGDFRGHALLDLQALGVGLDDPCQLGNSDHAPIGQIAHVDVPDDGSQMVLAVRHEMDIAQHHHLVVT